MYAPLSSYKRVYVPTSKASVVSVYTAAEIDQLLLNYMPGYVAGKIAEIGSNLDGGYPDTVYGGMDSIDGGGVT